MDKSDSHRRKKFKVPKPDSNVSTSHKWTIFVIFLSFVLSLVFSLITSVAMQSLNLFFAFIVLFAIIAINILFDMIGSLQKKSLFIPLRHAKSKVQEKVFP